ncbi:MAG: NAD(P)H-hydrate dehydratase [Patescibacteria group bacterium]
MFTIKTTKIQDINPFVEGLFIPKSDSHKGQNGKVMIVGGSQLFHAASLWSAEIASHFVDMLHFSSIDENNVLFQELKKKFRNGIVVPRDQIDSYIEEDDAILIGPGMERDDLTKSLTEKILSKHVEKKFVLDAGALQMMDAELLKKFKEKVIVTPHQGEFEQLFHLSLEQLTIEEKTKHVQEYAKKYKCVILLKAVVDIISDGVQTYVIEGGNQGLTKGGTGDILAGLTTALYAKNDPVTSCVIASFLLKKTADRLYLTKGYWYNNTDLILQIPETLSEIVFKKTI